MSSNLPVGPPAPMVSIQDLEHPHAIGRRIKTGLTLVGAAAGVVLALAAAPSATADTVDMPDFPIVTDEVTSTSSGIPLLFNEIQSTQYATYTDLLGDHVAETAPGASNPLGSDPLNVTYIFVPNETSPTFVAIGDVDPNFGVASLNNGDVSGSSFSVIGSGGSGFYNLYEDTPFEPSGGGTTQNIDDVFAFFPTHLSDSASDIAFGIQYLDLPNAANPVDEINFLGQAGEILFSIPVTGDLLSGL